MKINSAKKQGVQYTSGKSDYDQTEEKPEVKTVQYPDEKIVLEDILG
jgi:hypothetical protein